MTDIASKYHVCLRFAHYRASQEGDTYPVLPMMHLRWFPCDYLLAMATRNNSCTMLYELSLESLGILENNSENHSNENQTEISKDHK